MQKNDPKTLQAWCMYDWANSVFSLTITTAVFPEYFLSMTSQHGHNMVNFWGVSITNSVLYSYAVSISFLFAALLSPVSTSIAEVTGRKKRFMTLFAYLGSMSCAALYAFHSGNVDWVIPIFIMASIGYSSSIVFYNSFLPDIATEDKFDWLSARGFSLGYIGSVLLLIANLVLILNAEALGITTGYAARISFLMVGLWWFVFSSISFSRLPNDVPKPTQGFAWISKGFLELKEVWQKVMQLKLLKTFLLSFFIYNMGVQTVMYLAPLFAKEVIKIESSELILTILIIQLVAIVGAYFFQKLSSYIGNTLTLTLAISVWIGVCIWAYFVTKGLPFYLLAGAIGFVMGGIQSMSRSTYSKLIPSSETNTASFFSFYDVTEKISIVLGTFLFGLISQVTGYMRNTILFLTALFVVGGIIMLMIPSKKSYGQ
jgi:UMF1 family MFS transporter